jgi:hypothetical protein
VENLVQEVCFPESLIKFVKILYLAINLLALLELLTMLPLVVIDSLPDGLFLFFDLVLALLQLLEHLLLRLLVLLDAL